VDLERYFERIGYRGTPSGNLETLTAIHRAHLLAIPYENLDIHLGRRLVLDQDRSYQKLVVERRGGWCYEMNGLFAAVLERLGFRVTKAWGTVGRASRGEAVEGNHLVLLVDLDRRYLADVGFGDGSIDPLPLEVGGYRTAGFEVAIGREGDRWVFRNHQYGAAAEFDFTEAPRVLADFRPRSDALQTEPDSPFVQKTVVQRHRPEGIVTLRGAVRSLVSPGGIERRTLKDPVDFQQTLATDFGLDLGDQTARLWAIIEERHRQWLAESPEQPPRC